MGKLVIFWSPYAGKSKVTSSMCAIAAQFGMNYPELCIAVSHTNPDEFVLEEKIDIRTGEEEEKQELYKRTGLAALKINYRQGALTSEKIRRSAIPLRMKSLFLYPNAELKKDAFSFQLLSETLKEEFDLVFLDTESGMQEDTSKYFAAADLIVVVLPQEPSIWERYLLKEAQNLEGKNSCIIIGGYMKTVKYGRGFFYRKNDIRQKQLLCGVIPLNGGFFDAMAEGNTLDFFYRNQRIRSKEENYEFFVQTKKTAENIRKKLLS